MAKKRRRKFTTRDPEIVCTDPLVPSNCDSAQTSRQSVDQLTVDCWLSFLGCGHLIGRIETSNPGCVIAALLATPSCPGRARPSIQHERTVQRLHSRTLSIC
jgi:hypothetical protein